VTWASSPCSPSSPASYCLIPPSPVHILCTSGPPSHAIPSTISGNGVTTSHPVRQLRHARPTVSLANAGSVRDDWAPARDDLRRTHPSSLWSGERTAGDGGKPFHELVLEPVVGGGGSVWAGSWVVPVAAAAGGGGSWLVASHTWVRCPRTRSSGAPGPPMRLHRCDVAVAARPLTGSCRPRGGRRGGGWASRR
jgi:hypothetical protein